MKLRVQRKLAAYLFKAGGKRVIFDPARLKDIKEAITKTDMRGLIGEKAVKVRPVKGISKARARKRKVQRRKGLQKGPGKRQGKANARSPTKRMWMRTQRHQREFLKMLRDSKKITTQDYRNLYLKAKGGFFRSKRHIKIYLKEKRMVKDGKA